MGTWKDVSDRVLPGVDVRAALAAVESAGAQAGIVYRTDAAPSKKVRIVFAVPIDQGRRSPIPSPRSLDDRPTRKLAPSFEFLASSSGRTAFEKFGFAFLPRPRSSE